MNKLEEALNYDPLHEAERATGEDSATNERTTALGWLLMQQSAAHKEKLLREAGDVYWGQKLPEWVATVESLGFELVLDEPINGTSDRYRIFWRPGILLTSDSYFGDTSVNSAKATFNFKGPRDALFHCSSGWVSDVDGVPVWDADFDAREAVRMRIERMESAGEILPEWIEKRFLWLLHYQDTKQEGYDHEAITAARAAKLPAEVRTAIGRCRPETETTSNETPQRRNAAQWPRERTRIEPMARPLRRERAGR